MPPYSSLNAPFSRHSALCSGSAFLSLGWRSGIVVALSIPLVLSIVFVIMNIMGIDLHRITLGALIIALGLLVDDAIIAVEMMAVKMEQGWSRTRAAAFAWESTAFPMLTGTLVTAAGFLPVGFANSAWANTPVRCSGLSPFRSLSPGSLPSSSRPFLGVRLLPEAKRKAERSRMTMTPSTRQGLIAHLRGLSVGASGFAMGSSLRHAGRIRRNDRCRSAWSSSSSSRCPSGRSYSSSCVCRRAPASARHSKQRSRPKRCSRAIPTPQPTRPMSVRAPRASGSASIRSCRMKRLPRSSSSPRTSKPANA